MMRKTTLILIFLAIVACGRTQDFLTPESYGIYSSVKYGNETLFRLMFPEDKSDYAVWNVRNKSFFLCAPSFSAEYALEIGKNQLILTKADRSVYMALSEYLRKSGVAVVNGDDVRCGEIEKICKTTGKTLIKIGKSVDTYLWGW